MVPFWSKPYSSSASFNNCMKSGWLKYITGTTNLCCSSPWPTFIAINPFGITSLNTLLLLLLMLLLFFSPCWRRWRCKWKLLGLIFSPWPISAKKHTNKNTPKRFKLFYVGMCVCFGIYFSLSLSLSFLCLSLSEETHKKTRQFLLRRLRDENLRELGALLDMAAYWETHYQPRRLWDI